MLRTHPPHTHRRSSRREGRRHASAWPRAGAIVVAVLLVSALLDACGSSSSTASNVGVKQTCKEVEAVLSDGPEPAADPVGYAQAQVLPLRQIRTSDRKLHGAIDRLASAYQTIAAEGRAGHALDSTVTAAVAGIDGLCPGAAS